MKKWALVTGASNGIGSEVAIQLVEKDYYVIVLARSKEGLDRIKQRFPDRITTLTFDLNDFKDYDKLLTDIEKITPSIDVLINNAGILINKPFLEMSISDFENMTNVNYKAPYFITQLLLPLISASQKKAIINIGSMGGVDNTSKFPGLSIYSSSKGAITTLTECLATEIAPLGCTINCLALGAVQTEMLEKAFPGYIPNLTPEKMAKFIVSFVEANDGIVNGKVLQIAQLSV